MDTFYKVRDWIRSSVETRPYACMVASFFLGALIF
jgi:hypothetical protein